MDNSRSCSRRRALPSSENRSSGGSLLTAGDENRGPTLQVPIHQRFSAGAESDRFKMPILFGFFFFRLGQVICHRWPFYSGPRALVGKGTES